jgi:hypothetical protein
VPVVLLEKERIHIVRNHASELAETGHDVELVQSEVFSQPQTPPPSRVGQAVKRGMRVILAASNVHVRHCGAGRRKEPVVPRISQYCTNRQPL